MVFQVWEWHEQDRYTVRHFIIDRSPAGWDVTERKSTYRALCRARLTDALERAAF